MYLKVAHNPLVEWLKFENLGRIIRKVRMNKVKVNKAKKNLANVSENNVIMT